MQTSDLIARLAADTRRSTPAPGTALGRGVVVGAIPALGVMLVLIGAQPELGSMARATTLAMKLGYAALLGLPAFLLAEMLCRPGSKWSSYVELLLASIATTCLVAAWQLSVTPTILWSGMIFGSSSTRCLACIVVLALPALVFLLTAMRRQAPVQHFQGGVAAGTCAGALGAAVYSFTCTEASAPFVLLWYTGAIGIVAIIGGLAALRVLRW